MRDDREQLDELHQRGLLTDDEYRKALDQLPSSPGGDASDEPVASAPASPSEATVEPVGPKQSALRRWAPAAVAAVVVLVGLAGVAWLQRDVPVEPSAEDTDDLAEAADETEEVTPEVEDEAEQVEPDEPDETEVEQVEPDETDEQVNEEPDEADGLMDALSRNPGPDEVSTWVLEAWARDNRTEAEVVADPGAVNSLFERTPPGGVRTPASMNCEDLGMNVSTPPFRGINNAVRCTATFGDETIVTSVEGGPSLGFYIVGIAFGDEPLPSLVMLRGDGLGVATFGDPEPDVRAALEAHLGGSDPAGWDCPPEQGLRWDGLTVAFVDGVFVHYHLFGLADAQVSGLTTAQGISLGSSRADLEAAYGPDLEIRTWQFDVGFPEETSFTLFEPDGQILGDLDGPDADSEVVGLFAGERFCGDL